MGYPTKPFFERLGFTPEEARAKEDRINNKPPPTQEEIYLAQMGKASGFMEHPKAERYQDRSRETGRRIPHQ